MVKAKMPHYHVMKLPSDNEEEENIQINLEPTLTVVDLEPILPVANLASSAIMKKLEILAEELKKYFLFPSVA